MPRSVRVAVVTAHVIVLLGVASFVIWAIDLFTGGAGTRALGTRALGSLISPLFMFAYLVPLAAARRDGRMRELAFQFALLWAMLLGFLAVFALVSAFMQGVDANAVVSLGVFALAVLLASSLSRPSAKAWFTSPTRPV